MKIRHIQALIITPLHVLLSIFHAQEKMKINIMLKILKHNVLLNNTQITSIYHKKRRWMFTHVKETSNLSNQQKPIQYNVMKNVLKLSHIIHLKIFHILVLNHAKKSMDFTLQKEIILTYVHKNVRVINSINKVKQSQLNVYHLAQKKHILQKIKLHQNVLKAAQKIINLRKIQQYVLNKQVLRHQY